MAIYCPDTLGLGITFSLFQVLQLSMLIFGGEIILFLVWFIFLVFLSPAGNPLSQWFLLFSFLYFNLKDNFWQMLLVLKQDNNSDVAVMWTLVISTAWQLIHCEESSVFSCRNKCICQRYQDVRFPTQKRSGWGSRYELRFLIYEAQVLHLSGNFSPPPSSPFSKSEVVYAYSVMLLFFLSIAPRAQNTRHSLSYMCLGVFSNGMKFLFPQKQERLGFLLVKPEIFHFSHLLSTFLSGRCPAFLSYIERL